MYFEMSMSLDGCIAGPNISLDNPLGDRGERLHDWMFEGRTDEEFRAFAEDLFVPCGAMVMGRRMLDLGIEPWGNDPTFHMPVFVVTHQPREPIVKQGGTTYHFVASGVASAFEQARAAAGSKDIAIAGGADLVQQCLEADLVEEIRLHLVPIVLGAGTRLFEGIDADALRLETTSVVESDGVVHLRYRVLR